MKPSSGFEFSAPPPHFTGRPNGGFSFAPEEPCQPAMTMGSHTISQNSDGAYMLGTQTLRPGQSLTQSDSEVIALQTSAGKTNLVVAASSKTSTADMGEITFAAKPSATHHFTFVPTVVTIKGSTIKIGGGATLNAAGSEPAGEPTASPGLQSDNAAPAGKMVSVGGVVAGVAAGVFAVL